MSLKDINFQEGEGQDFILEKLGGSLNSPKDIIMESSLDNMFLSEVPEDEGGGNIFIMSE